MRLSLGEFRTKVRNSSLADIGRRVFGDRLGVIVFLAAISVYLSYWRIGMLINDSYTLANTLVAVSEGHLHVERAVYGSGLNTPGMGTRDGRYYGRNYGQVFLALPLYWVLKGVAAIAALRIALAALWSISLIVLLRLIGTELDCRATGTYVGCSLALVVFAGVTTGATSIDASQHHLIALQLQTMIAAAMVGVVCYRLFSRAYSRTIGLAGGLAASLVTPIGFWAQFPKRHALATFCVMTTMYLFYRSREGGGVNTRYRAAAYLPIGIVAWVSAAEGIILLLALLAVDVPTGGRDLRSLVAAGVTGVLAVVPMFATNFFVTGNPAKPPRMQSGNIVEEQGKEASGGSGSGGTGGSTESQSDIFDTIIGGFDFLFELLGRGIVTVFTDFQRLYPTFIRGGYIPRVASRDAGEAIRLSFLEAMPLVAALVAIPVILVRSNGTRGAMGVEWRRLGALGRTDVFVIIYTILLTLVYIPRIPIHAAITVRYLLALFPLALYGLIRIASVRRVLEEQTIACAFTYLGGLLIGGQLLVVYLWWLDAARGEAVQAHALVGLLVATLVAGWAVADAGGYRNDRLGAVVLGLAAAAGTSFTVLAGFWHFSFVGELALPLL